MEFSTEARFDVVVVAFWNSKGCEGVFKRVECVSFESVSLFHYALTTFYPEDFDSGPYRRAIVQALLDGRPIHLDCWGLQLLFLPGDYNGLGAEVADSSRLNDFFRYGEKRPKQFTICSRPAPAESASGRTEANVLKVNMN